MSSLLNIVLEKGNALCFLHVYLESNGYNWKIALLMILLNAAVTGENKPQVVYSESEPYVTFVYRLGGAKILAEVETMATLSGSFINEC